jgi:hypothetical protein
VSKTEVVLSTGGAFRGHQGADASPPSTQSAGAAIPACSRRRNMPLKGSSVEEAEGFVRDCGSRGMPTHDFCGQL